MKLWGGCFDSETDKVAFMFQSSINVDKRLYEEDIMGSIAHAKTLMKCGVLTSDETEKIESELLNILSEIKEGRLDLDQNAEDIHSDIEALLVKRIGDIGKKLHTGRSRNDQVATDFRMYLAKEVDLITSLLVDLETTLLNRAKENVATIMPGYTHLQKAQPITFGHYLMAYFEMFKRDLERLGNCRERILIMPLGSGALAGTTYPLDRHYTASLLGFNRVANNSLDAVSDRDFVIELASDLSILMMHLSRFCEEIVIFASQEFSYIQVDDAYSTGSSIMPQKKNPDMAELIRGKTGRVYGSLMTILTIMKALPLAYNKDMQEDKESIFDSIDTVKNCLTIFTRMISTMKVNAQRMYKSAEGGYTNATDLADYLVKKGIPFRECHEISGKIVRYAISLNKNLSEISLDEFKKFSELIEVDIYNKISLENCVQSRQSIGGTAREAVKQSIYDGEQFLIRKCKAT